MEQMDLQMTRGLVSESLGMLKNPKGFCNKAEHGDGCVSEKRYFLPFYLFLCF